MKAAHSQDQLASAQTMVADLQRELRQTNHGVVALTLELELRLDQLTQELNAAHEELHRTNSELMQLTLELDDRVALRTAELSAANQRLQQQIAERKRAEEQIQRLNAELEHRVLERTEQLQMANKQLESFSFSVSHDLRAPLRAILGFVNLLLEECASELTGEGLHFLQMIREGAENMGKLIEALLVLSRSGREPLRKQPVDTAHLVRSVLAELAPQREGRQIDLQLRELPACNADPALLKQVWTNLLSNAFKYTQKQPQAVVEIGCDQGPDGNVYYVRDNGAGFDMAYAQKLFGVFQRLHRGEEFEGTGVGLALVQQIVLRHGGRIWAEAAVDHGATFFFTLEDAL